MSPNSSPLPVWEPHLTQRWVRGAPVKLPLHHAPYRGRSRTFRDPASDRGQQLCGLIGFSISAPREPKCPNDHCAGDRHRRLHDNRYHAHNSIFDFLRLPLPRIREICRHKRGALTVKLVPLASRRRPERIKPHSNSLTASKHHTRSRRAILPLGAMRARVLAGVIGRAT